jgi:hypothetical protein
MVSAWKVETPKQCSDLFTEDARLQLLANIQTARISQRRLCRVTQGMTAEGCSSLLFTLTNTEASKALRST